MCADAGRYAWTASFPQTCLSSSLAHGAHWYAYQTVEKRFRGDPRRNTQRYPYAFTSRVSTSPGSTFICIPCAPRYRVHPRTTPRSALPPSHGRLPFLTLPKTPPPFTNGHVGQSHARTSCYLSAPTHISHLITHGICCLSSCSHLHVFHLFGSLRYHDIVFAHSALAGRFIGPHVGAFGYVASSLFPSHRIHYTRIAFPIVSHRFSSSLLPCMVGARGGRRRP